MRNISEASRSDYILFNTLEDAVRQDNPVRLYDLLVDRLALAHPKEFEFKGLKKVGRPSYASTTLVKLFLYGYLNRIQSSRRLEDECYRNLEVKWLLGDLRPDHWTINNFRKNNGKLIRFVTLEFRKFLKNEGYITGKVQATDGSKIKANASRDMLNMATITERLNKIDKQLKKYLKNANKIDELEDLKEEFALESPDKKFSEALVEKVKKLEKEVKKLQSAKEALEKSGKKYIAPNDLEATLVKGRDGKFPGYNAQTIVDSENKLISYGEISAEANDRKFLKKNLAEQEEQIGITPEIFEADRGYSYVHDIKEIEDTGKTECIVPLQKTSQENKDKKNGIKFTYNKDKDEYKCSEGVILKKIRNKVKSGEDYYKQYQGQNCEGCKLKELCTKSNKGRLLRRNINQEWIESYKEKLKTPKNKARIKERKSLVEHPFGTIKVMMGKLGFLLVGQKKVQIEFDLYATAYNLKRMFSIEDRSVLMGKIANYAW